MTEMMWNVSRVNAMTVKHNKV